MPTNHHNMSPADFRAVCLRKFADPARAGDEGLSALSRFLGYEPRTVRLWAEKGPPAAVAMFLRTMDALKLTPADVIAAIERATARKKR